MSTVWIMWHILFVWAALSAIFRDDICMTTDLCFLLWVLSGAVVIALSVAALLHTLGFT